MSNDLKSLIAASVERPLSASEAESAFEIIMEGLATPAQIGGFLIALRTRGETVDEYAAAAAVMRSKCKSVHAPANAIDIVGTGGDGKGTLNISTATALVVAGAGIPVAKHGNRNLSSKSGAADVLSCLGVTIEVGSETVETAIKEAGIGFMMAPMHHPAMRHCMPARQELGTRTIFNILGPLTNPAGVSRQLSGAFSPSLLKPMAETLDRLGSKHAWIVHGHDGTDEISISGPTDVVILKNGSIQNLTIEPINAGLPTHKFETIRGASPRENAAALQELLDGAQSPYRDAVLLNAAAALVIAEAAGSLHQGVEMGRHSIDSGKARDCLNRLIRITGDAAA